MFSASVLAQYYRKEETFHLYITFPWSHMDYDISMWEPLP